MFSFDVSSKNVSECIEITNDIRKIIISSGVQNGICTIFIPHTTAAITINEHADPSVIDDISGQLEKIVPQHLNYRHSEGNSAAHIKASLLGSSQQIIIENGNLVLGTWQGIFFCEFDGPRMRKVIVKILPG